MYKQVIRIVAVVLSSVLCQAAGAWPDRPVRLVVPYPPGAMGDTVARLLSQQLAQFLKQPVIVENRAGASGNIGAASVARADDGHTFLVAATNNLVINQFLYADSGFDPLKAFVPVSMLVDVPSGLFVNTNTTAVTAAQFFEQVKTHPKQHNYGSPGSGTTVHLFSDDLNRQLRLGMTHVPYKGAAQAVTALLANDIQLLNIGVGIGAPYVKSGRLRLLAVSSSTRLPEFPAIPTFAEANLPSLGASNWWAVVAPSNVSAATVATLRRAIDAALSGAALRSRLDELGVTPMPLSVSEIGTKLATEAAFWKQVIQATGVKVE